MGTKEVRYGSVEGNTMTANEAVAAAYNVARAFERHGFDRKHIAAANELAGEALTFIVAPKVYELVADALDALTDGQDITASDIDSVTRQAVSIKNEVPS